MIVSKTFEPYNYKRMQKPWGALITFEGVKPVYNFDGRCERDSRTVVIEANAGDIVAFGQKDMRRGNLTTQNWYRVRDDGSLVLVTEAEARGK